jgi:spermidine/putrescine transport system ATP-binding protein
MSGKPEGFPLFLFFRKEGIVLIELSHLSKTFDGADGPVEAVSDVCLTIRDGDIFGIIGLSGAGKSTLVRCINRLETPTAGEVLFDGVPMSTLTPGQLRERRRQMSMIFQSFNLLEQRTALRNVCYPLEIAGTPRAQARKRASELLALVGLADRAGAFPSQLSGGQKQRVAIARALVNGPRVLLLDEPLGALDFQLRKQMQLELKKLQRQLGITFVYVTHDQEEAMTMSDRIAVMHAGTIEQADAPDRIYRQPVSRYVAGFIGESNLFGGRVADGDGTVCRIDADCGSMLCPNAGFAAGTEVQVCVRPEFLRAGASPVPGFTLTAQVTQSIFTGNLIKTLAVMPDGREVVLSRLADTEAFAPGARLYLSWEPKNSVVMAQ